MNYSAFIGIDVSKDKLDFVVLIDGEKVLHMVVENNTKGIMKFMKTLTKSFRLSPPSCLFCMEHTGIYCDPFLKIVSKKGLSIWLEDAKKIRAYHGLVRDKNDAIDAYRIAEYAYSKRHQIKLWEPPRPIIEKLKKLVTLRRRLVETKIRLKVPLKEEKGFCDKDWVRFHNKTIKPILDQTTSRIQELEQQILSLIETDDTLKHLFELVTSVKGVGLVVGVNTIVTTNEFKSINDPRKMACHCGVAPFRQQSGKSIRGKSKVSHQADKSMKSLYNLSARSAVSRKGELRDYYLRKVEDGKNKMTVMNAVRNKIIHRIFACVRDNRKYENIYVHNLA